MPASLQLRRHSRDVNLQNALIRIAMNNRLECQKETQPTFPLLNSSGEGIVPRRRSSEALLTTGSFCMLRKSAVVRIVRATHSDMSRYLDTAMTLPSLT